MRQKNKKQVARLIKKAFKSIANKQLEYWQNPRVKIGYSIGLTGNIQPKEHLEQFTLCSCKSDKEHKAKWETYKKTHPPQPLDFETIKSRYDINEKYLTYILNKFCINPPKRLGRPNRDPETLMRGRPHSKYQVSQEKINNLCKENIDSLCSKYDIDEKELMEIAKKNMGILF